MNSLNALVLAYKEEDKTKRKEIQDYLLNDSTYDTFCKNGLSKPLFSYDLIYNFEF